MAKERKTIYLTLFKDSDWNKLVSETKYRYANGILLIYLILKADDEGKGKIIPDYIKGDVFFCEQHWTTENIFEILDNIKYLFRNILFFHHHKDKVYYKFLNWEKYQYTRKDRCKKSILPNPSRRRIIKGSIKSFFIYGNPNVEIEAINGGGTPIKFQIPSENTENNSDKFLEKKKKMLKIHGNGHEGG